MPKISLDNLERYDGHLKNWCDARFASKSVNENWSETEEAGAVQFYPVSDTEIHPVVKFSFKETPPASGDKGPTNPSTITGVSSVKATRCGKNVCSTKYLRETGTGGLYTFDAATGGIKISGTTDSRGGALEFRSVFGSSNALRGGMLQRGKTYTFSHTGNASTETYPYFRLYVQDTASSGWANRVQLSNGSSATYTIPSTAYACLIRIDLNYNATYNCECFVQIEEGSVATPFEKYEGTDYTLSLGNTYYGGEVDLATGIMTVTHWGRVLNGSNSNFLRMGSSTQETSYFQWANIQSLAAAKSAYCTHFQYEYDLTEDNKFVFYSSTGTFRIRVSASEFPDATSFNNWIANQYNNGTPVVFCCELAAVNHYTVQLTPLQIKSLTQSNLYTPRLNTVYTDADTVKVRYQKSPIVTSSDIDNAILSLGGD